MENSFCHFELNSNDPDKAREFYKEMFDWKYEDFPMGEETYTMIKTGKEPGGGIFKNPVPNVPSHWLAYIQVEDIKASTENAVKLGGVLLKEVTEIPDMGSFSVIQDPTGAVFAMWQPK